MMATTRRGVFCLATFLLLLAVADISLAHGNNEQTDRADNQQSAASANGLQAANAEDQDEDQTPQGRDAVGRFDDDDTPEQQSRARRIGIVRPGPRFQVDLRSGVISGTPPAGVSWVVRPTNNTRPCRCDRQAVLKLSFSPLRRRAQIRMTFEYSTRFSFNLGDSSTNNGWAGDAGTQSNDAEVHSYYNTMFFYGRDKQPSGTYGFLYSEPSFVGAQPYTTLTMDVRDEEVRADNGFHTLYFNSYKLFQLAGQPDPSHGGVNRDLYLGLNRVVGTSVRNGQGLCKVSVRFFPF